MYTKTEIEARLKQCRIPVNQQTVGIAQSLVKLDKRMEEMDLVHLSILEQELLGVEPIEWYKRRFPKDMDVVEDLLGKNVSPTEAYHTFIEKTIQYSKIPRQQKDLVDGKKRTFLDPITLQQQSLDQVVQLRESGELMSKGTLEEYIKNNTSTWQGKPNVGFFSPITNTMMGTPTLYNFDRVDFFPQKPGTLTVTLVKNLQNVPASKKPLIIPVYYIQMKYQTLTFYLPYTPEGIRVFFLFKDAFKKGNLFAVDKTGYIRHGRVHKRTSLTGGSHSFPDDTYLERVSGELASLGSTLYTYRHSHDKIFDFYADPYPDEKRFKITIMKN